MELVIVRHAIAAERDPGKWSDDRERPLTAAGIRRFRSVARHLKKLVPGVRLVWSSPLARAWQTAEILHEEAGWPAPSPCAGLEPEADPRAVPGWLRKHARLERAALVGHEPGLHELVSYLLCGTTDGVSMEMKKGGAVLLAFSAGIRPGAARLLWHLPPRAIPGVED